MAYLTKMITKIISFPHWHFERKEQLPISLLMIVALSTAYEKQKEGIPIGISDIKGSFT